MTLHRAYVQTKWLTDLKPHALVELPSDVLHRLTKVVRVSEREVVELFDGKGLCVKGRVKDGRFEVLDVECKVKGGPRLILAQALVAPGKLEVIIQQATQIGADSILIFTSKNCVTKVTGRSDGQIERLNRIAVDSARQCERADVPAISGPIKFEDCVESFRGKAVFVGDPRSKAQLAEVVEKSHDEIVLVIGPEGGLDEHEVLALERSGAKAVRYAPYVLRTEIAGLVGLSIIQSKLP